jgi:hypothetical protein
MSGFQDLERQLLDAIERKGSRRSPRAATFVVLASSALVVAVAAFAIVLLGQGKAPSPPNHPPAGSPPPKVQPPTETAEGGMQVLVKIHANAREARDVNAALFAIWKTDRACAPVPPPYQTAATLSQAAPSSTMLSVLGVLRRAATTADELPAPVSHAPLLTGSARTVYVRYVRRARVVAGVAYYRQVNGGQGGTAPPPNMIWRAASGRVIKTVTTPSG